MSASNGYDHDDGGFTGRYGNGRHQRQLQQKQNKQAITTQQPQQKQRFSYADPMSDGTLRGVVNTDFQQSTENFYSNPNSGRPQDLPVFTVSASRVAFSTPAPGESSTDDTGANRWPNEGTKQSGLLASRPRLILAAAILLLAAAAVILIITLPTVLIANRQYEAQRRAAVEAAALAARIANRQEARANQREINCGLLTASSVSTVASSTVYRFNGIPYALPPNGTGLLLPARPIDSQEACRQAWSMTPDEAATVWDQRRLRYPHGDRPAPMCLQFDNLGDSPTATMDGGSSTDCLYLDVATPAADPGSNLPTVVLVSSMLGIYTPASLLLNPPEDLFVSDGGAAAVFVSVRHRLGPLAFVTHLDLVDESPHRVAGNLPVSDLATALLWLRINVRAFGGAPDNVILTGYGSSATAALNLAFSGQFDHLFHKLWLSAPPVNTEMQLASAIERDKNLAPCLKASCRAALNPVTFAASVPWARLNNELRADYFEVPALAGAPVARRGFSVVDGFRVTQSPINAALRKPLNKPMVLGSMLEDTAMYFIDGTSRHWPESYLLDHIDSRLSAGGVNGTGLAAIASGWYRDLGYWNDSTPVVRRYAQVVTDLRLTCSLIEFSRRLAATAASAGVADWKFYRYLMSSMPAEAAPPYPWSKFPVQAAFGGFDLMQLLGRPAASRQQTASWRAAFHEFARTGGVAAWQRYNSLTRMVNLIHGPPVAVSSQSEPRGDLCDRWKEKFHDLSIRGWYA